LLFWQRLLHATCTTSTSESSSMICSDLLHYACQHAHSVTEQRAGDRPGAGSTQSRGNEEAVELS
jgi:hypothetical protein